MDDHFKVRVSVLQWPSRAPVHHKPDGQRFSHPNTLKLRANRSYLVEVLVSPARTLTSLFIQGQALFLSQIPADRHHGDARKYSALWNTSGYDVNKDTTRTFIPFTLEFKGGAMLLTTIQCKLYSGEGDGGHWQWGQALHAIELECCAKPEASYVDVTRDRFVDRRMF